MDIEISQRVYDMLVEIAKLDKLDPILVLHIDGEESKRCVMPENWLKNQTGTNNKT